MAMIGKARAASFTFKLRETTKFWKKIYHEYFMIF
jgi:hypothetical protein